MEVGGKLPPFYLGGDIIKKLFKKIKKPLICFMFMTILIPSYKVRALTGNDSKIYPEVPTDKGSAYVIYKNNDGDINLVVYPEKTFGVAGDTFNLFVSTRYVYFGSGTNSTNSSVHCYKLSEDEKTWEYQSLDRWGCSYDYTNEFDWKDVQEDPASTLKPLLDRIVISSSVNYKRDGVIVYDTSELRSMIIINNLVCDVENDREFYLIDFDLGDFYDSKYKLYYGYGNYETHKHSAEFNPETKKATIKHAFSTVAIYYELIANDDLDNPVISGVHFVPRDGLNAENILITEEATYDEDNKRIIKTTLDFSNFEKFRDIHPDIQYMINYNLTEEINYTWIINNSNYDDFETKYIRVFLGDYAVIDETKYHPKLNGDTSINDFESKYALIVEEELSKDFDIDNLDSASGITGVVKSFIESIKDLIISFFTIIKNFFDRLNIWIRAYIVSIACIYVISKIIKAVRK